MALFVCMGLVIATARQADAQPTSTLPFEIQNGRGLDGLVFETTAAPTGMTHWTRPIRIVVAGEVKQSTEKLQIENCSLETTSGVSALLRPTAQPPARELLPGASLSIQLEGDFPSAGLYPYRATTVISDIPNDVVVWRGELRGPADVYAWTSTDRGNRRTLADLLALRTITHPVTILRATNDDPRSLRAAGASMQLAAVARASLFDIAHDVAAAFRGSFGGDYPGTGLNSAASVSFAIAIDRLDD